MRTETAIVFNKVSGQAEEMTATKFEELHRGNKPLGIYATTPLKDEDVEIASSDNALPLKFRRSYYRNGGEEFVRACWVRPDGFGDDDHIFERDQQNFKEAVLAGKSVLLSLNLRLSSIPVSFRNMPGHDAKNLEEWISEKHGSYITVSVNSVEDTIKSLGRFRELAGDSAGERVFAMHMGAVVPFKNFFIGTQRKIASLYNDMQNGFGGVSLGNTRFIGFPRLMPFIPTAPTIKSGAAKGLKGNHVKAEKGKPYLAQIVFDKRDEDRNTDDYQRLRNSLVGGEQAVYVLATPSITRPASRDDWKHMRLSVDNITAQTLAIDPEMKAKLLRHREIEEQKLNDSQGNNPSPE